ncbi:endoplasmic reticulum metallopeptidase 1 [Drosophila ananassae]|uniref:endoplasmic reticulum metallopeptidase 1 n=1 Tax=Drosophila ananassae TaxID=7217 RepID=UPI0013A5E0EA|nr:endoplasmic reticulum metallopeptidase 1 [Drosophila ananassae]
MVALPELKSDLPSDTGSENLIIEVDGERRPTKRFAWYYAPTYLLFWVGLFFAVIYPLFQNLPTGLKISQESDNPGKFVAERAQAQLLEISLLGPRLVGDTPNEVTVVKYLLDEIEKIRLLMREDLYEMEVEVQRVSGSYVIKGFTNHYQAVQNVLVKLSTKSSNSTNYLLVNSHYDTKPGAPGAGDDVSMVVVMLEVLRQVVISEDEFFHPIVFLFNGAEEQPMQGSHGFITQHRWAANCKALLNMDSCGAGGREMLFQGGPDHPWLMEHYRSSAPHPFATTTGEEVFQSGIIPSDTDFRIFRDFGVVPGLDMAGVYNGFVYHTEFDRYTVVSRDSLQHTGDNLLALVRSISRSVEMYDTLAYSEGHAIFFDFIGLFFVHYQQSTGVALNITFSVAAIIFVCASLWRMSKVSGQTLGTYAGAFGLFFLLALFGIVLALLFPVLMSVFYDAGDRTLTYFSNSWLVIGLYICPSVIGLVLPVTLYLTHRPSLKIPHTYQLQIVGHANCILLVIMCLSLTVLKYRSAYLFLISLVFYVASLIINLASRLHCRGYLWSALLGLSQIVPFLYHAYLFHTFIIILLPMVGRFGVSSNPDMIIAALVAIGTILSLSFAAPLINIFRRPNCMLGGLALVMFIFCMISVSDVGFPYRPKTNVMRADFMQVHRRFFEYDGSMSLEDSGYYFHLNDRNKEAPLRKTMNLTGLVRMGEDCDDNEMMCGLPCYRFCTARQHALWLPREELVELPYPTTLQLLNKTVLSDGYQVRYEFLLSGPPNMGLFFQPLDGVKILGWTFAHSMLENPATYRPPLNVLLTYGIDSSPTHFFVEFSKYNGKFDEPVFELGVSGHYFSPTAKRDDLTREFLATLPDFAFAVEWPSSYERYIF